MRFTDGPSLGEPRADHSKLRDAVGRRAAQNSWKTFDSARTGGVKPLKNVRQRADMNLILRLIMASILSFIGAALFLHPASFCAALLSQGEWRA